MKTKLYCTLKKSLIIFGLFLTSINYTFAQAPVNDICTNATSLSVYGGICGLQTTGDVTGATQSLPAIFCDFLVSSTANDIWYKFVATSASQTITVVPSASFDAVVQLLTAACGTDITCADNASTGGTELINATGLIVGTSYFIRVYSFGSSVPASTTFTICVTTPPPSNDECSAATPLTVNGSICSSPTTGNVAGATLSTAAAPCTGNSEDDVWYSFVATSTSHNITVVGSANFDAVVNLRLGACPGSSITCADNSPNGGTEVINATGLILGSTYTVRVYHFWPTTPSTTTFSICITTPSPANDNCAGAIPLTVYGATCGSAITGNVLGSTSSLAATCAGTADDDIWYSFIATSASHIITVVGSTNFDAVVDLRTGACNGTNISCKDASSSGGTEALTATGLTIGSTYYVRVYSYFSTVPATSTFTICITTPSPANDECSAAISLTVYGATCGGTVSGNTSGATQSIAATCVGTADDDIWYKFVATSSSHIISVAGSASFDAVIDLRSGACTGTNISCSDATGAGAIETLTATGLVSGSTYYLRVYHYFPSVPATTLFTICITTPAPVNDNCSGATALTVYGTTCGNSTTGNVSGATQSLAANCVGTADDDIWYSFVATAAAHNITAIGSASFDAVIDLRSGACNGTNINCKDATASGGTEVLSATGLTIGATYFVRIYHYGSAFPATSSFTICVTTPTPPPPANDNCSGAIALTVYGVNCASATSGNVTGATQSISPISCGNFTSSAANDIWYSFVANSTSHIITVVGSSTFDAVVDLRSGSCSGTNLNCSDAVSAGGTETLTATGLTIGATYFVRIYHFGGALPADPSLTICVTTPAPLNDECAGAQALTVYGTTCGAATTGNVFNASQSLAAITCNNLTGTANDDVWYSFVATAIAHDITVIGSANFDAVVDLRSGSCNGTNINCADLTSSGGVEIVFASGLTIGNTYFIRVYHYTSSTPATTTFTICITTPAPPAPINDNCSGAQALTVYAATCGATTTGNVLGATQSIAAITCNSFTGAADDDIWYSFIATSDKHVITVVGSSSFDAVIDLRSGSCSGTNINCADLTTSGGTELITATGLIPGTTYFIRVYSFSSSVPATTTFTICVTTPAPSNNDCSGATALTVYGATCGSATTGNVFGATQSLAAAPCNGTADDDVWYSFVATAASHVITVVGSLSFDAVLDLRSGSCNGSNITCLDASGTGATETLTATGLVSGTTYYVRVYHYYSAVPTTANFTICVTTPTPPAPANDDCSGAIALTVYGATCGGETTGNVASATQSIPSITCNGSTGNANEDVWYSFVATGTSHNVTVVGSSNFDAIIDLRSATCSAGTNLFCSDSSFQGGTEVVIATGLTIGATYYVRVYDYYSTVPATTTFTICVTTPTIPAPANNNCSGATTLTVNGPTCSSATNGTVAGATQSLAAIACNGSTGNANDDVWYKFTATSTSHNITVVGSASLNAVVDMHALNCSGANVDCADAQGNGGTEIINATGLTIGTLYFVRVYDFGSTVPATQTFTICVTTPAAAPPINDSCSSAIALVVYGATCGGSINGTVAAATQSLAAAPCSGSAEDDVWYKFVATATAHDITVIGSTNFNAVVDLRSGSCNGTNITCKDATAAAGTEVINATSLTIGTTYYLRVYDFGTTVPATTTFNICVTTPASTTPINDNCAGAISLTVYGATCGGATTGNVAGATLSLPGILCNNFTGTADDDIWYSFIATAASQTITVVGSSSFDAVVDLRTGACNGTNIACADTSFTGNTEILNANGLTVGNLYYVRVYHYSSSIPATTTFTICITSPTPSVPLNNECSGAKPITVYGATCGGVTTGDVAGATQSSPAITCNSLTGTANDDVWYSFVATANAHNVTVVGSTNLNAVVEILSGACPGVNLNCADATTAGGTELINLTGLTIGNTYFVRVYDFGSTVPATTTFTICVTTPSSATPINDFCGSPTSLTVYGATCGGATTGDINGGTQSAAPIACNGLTGSTAIDVWYSFVATAVTHTINVTGSTNFDAVIELRTNACSGTNIDCANLSIAAGTETIVTNNLTIGTTYFVRVYHYGSTPPATTTFTICITTPSSTAPINDNCSGATSLIVYGATCGGATTGNVTGATQSIPAITCGGSTGTADDDVWYSFVATDTSHNITVVGSASFDAVLDLRSGNCNGTNIRCADATFNGGTEIITATGLTIGATYFVRVYHYSGFVPTTTTFTICVTTPGPPPAAPVNNECASAISLTTYGSNCGGTVIGDVNGATQSIPATCSGTANDDIWYSFVATATTHQITVIGSASFDAVIDLRSGNCTGTNIACGDTSFAGGTEILNANALVIGDTYLIRVYHYSASVPTTTTFSICITTPCLAPNTTVSPSSETICAGESAILTANGANSYTWLPTIGLSNSNTATVTANPTATTTYTVTGTFGNCSGTQVVTITVNPGVTANITQIQNLLTSSPGLTYQWFLNGIILPGEVAQNHLATQNGNYTVVVTNAAGCTDTSPPFPIISFLGIDKLDDSNLVSIYPNPFNTSATIEIKGLFGNNDLSIIIYDMVGREVKNIALTSNIQSNQSSTGVSYTIDRNDLSNGMYYFKVSNKVKILGSGKFSIQ